MTAILILATFTVGVGLGVIAVTAWIECTARTIRDDFADALAAEAADWSEPTRAEVEAEWSDTPIFDATAAYIAGWEAQAIDGEWAALQRETGGAS